MLEYYGAEQLTVKRLPVVVRGENAPSAAYLERERAADYRRRGIPLKRFHPALTRKRVKQLANLAAATPLAGRQ